MKRTGQKPKAANTDRRVTWSMPADYLKTSLCLVLFLSCFCDLTYYHSDEAQAIRCNANQ